jgi:integrase
VSRRRANGEGSIFKHRRKGWVAAVSLPGGQRKYMYGRTREEVRQKLAEVTQARDTGTLPDARGYRLGDFLDDWLEEVVKPRVRHWTYVGYEVHVRLHIKPSLGHLPLDKVAPLHVQLFLNRKLEQGMSPKSVRYIRGTLRAALNQAMKWGLVARNAAALVDGPRVERHEIKPFTPDEARRFLASIRGDRLEALYSVALTLGLRQAEALGLRWEDIDLDRGQLTVSKQLQRIDRMYKLVDPKTSRSRRSLAMPPLLVDQLRGHRERQLDEKRAAGDQWTESGLIFTTEHGKPLERTTLTRQFHRHLSRVELPQRRFHDLRHSCATLLLVQGVSPRVVMELLGHSDIGMTMNTYSHVIPELRREAATRMQDLLNDQSL